MILDNSVLNLHVSPIFQYGKTAQDFAQTFDRRVSIDLI